MYKCFFQFYLVYCTYCVFLLHLVNINENINMNWITKATWKHRVKFIEEKAEKPLARRSFCSFFSYQKTQFVTSLLSMHVFASIFQNFLVECLFTCFVCYIECSGPFHHECGGPVKFSRWTTWEWFEHIYMQAGEWVALSWWSSFGLKFYTYSN